MKMKKGFMCHSTAATAVSCMASDSRSVVVPRRPHSTSLIASNANYSRLVKLGGDHLQEKQVKNPKQPVKKQVDYLQEKQVKNPNPAVKNKLSTAVLASSESQVFQVVVMRVSLHCQGCAGKLKKHLSKMEGVTSFSIDLETKKVTVMGHVSPTGLLESISKVKKAEFWTY